MNETEVQHSEIGYRTKAVKQAPRTEDAIDLVEVGFMLLAHWWQIAAASVLCAALMFFYTFSFISPTYQATSKMYLASISDASTLLSVADLQWGNNAKSDYKELLKSRPLLESVIESLNLDMSSTSLSHMINITNPTDTRILCVTVTAADPALAADIANELIVQCRIYLPEIMKMDAPSFYEPALVPTAKAGPSYSKNTLMGGLVGAVLCGGLYLVVYLMNDTIVTPDDVTKYLGVQPIAAIPEAEKKELRQAASRRNKRREKLQPSLNPEAMSRNVGDKLNEVLKEEAAGGIDR